MTEELQMMCQQIGTVQKEPDAPFHEQTIARCFERLAAQRRTEADRQSQPQVEGGNWRAMAKSKSAACLLARSTFATCSAAIASCDVLGPRGSTALIMLASTLPPRVVSAL